MRILFDKGLIEQALFSGAGFCLVLTIVHVFSVQFLGSIAVVIAYSLLLETVLNAVVHQDAMVGQSGGEVLSPQFLRVRYLILSLFGGCFIWVLDFASFGNLTIYPALEVLLFITLFHYPNLERRLQYLIHGSGAVRTAMRVTALIVWGRLVCLALIGLAYRTMEISEALSILAAFSLVLMVPLLWDKEFIGERSRVDLIRLAPSSKSRMIIISSAVEWLWGVLPLFVLNSLYGSTSAGLYTSARSLGNALNVINEMFASVQIKEISLSARRSLQDFLSALKPIALLWSASVALLIFIIVWMGEELGLLFFDEAIEDASLWLLCGVLVQVGYFVHMIMRTYLRVIRLEITNLYLLAVMIAVSSYMVQSAQSPILVVIIVGSISVIGPLAVGVHRLCLKNDL